MFDEQIKLLEQFISDWDNVLQDKPEHNWAQQAHKAYIRRR